MSLRVTGRLRTYGFQPGISVFEVTSDFRVRAGVDSRRLCQDRQQLRSERPLKATNDMRMT